MTANRKITAQLTKRGSREETEFNVNFWKQMDHEQKFAASWSMVNEYSLIRGHEGVAQQRLKRSVQSINIERVDYLIVGAYAVI